METVRNSDTLGRLSTVRLSRRERETAEAYLQKVEGIIDFIWFAAAIISSAINWAGGRGKTAAIALKPLSANA